MTSKSGSSVRCAIYTRKSSEEGLEQSFNSLQAQREACEAYITSQRHEGWHAISTHYDDGGYSGGNLDRPAVKRLLEDISAGKINTVVVYKVDRLTRSLADFAKIIEVFDAKGVSFVSVTQQFNTTSSMGRLTLNVLLSFAQFEREVTGERIRDKIAASKKKGMWMGGRVPLGYDLRDRKLIINPVEAELIREIFRQYQRVGCVRQLKEYLDSRELKTKIRGNSDGRTAGGKSFSRGALYQMLRNHLYIGEIHHRGDSYAGEHEAIVDRAMFEQVAEKLTANRHERKKRHGNCLPSLLAGKLFDEAGWRYTPSHTNKKGRRYRYYVSQQVIEGLASKSIMRRIAAEEIESAVLTRIHDLLSNPEELLKVVEEPSSTDLRTVITAGDKAAESWASMPRSGQGEYIRRSVKRVTICTHELRIAIDGEAFTNHLLGHEPKEQRDGTLSQSDNEWTILTCPFATKKQRNQLKLVVPNRQPASAVPNMPLLKAIARARSWYERIVAGEVISLEQLSAETGLSPRYVRRILRCASVSPKLTEQILNGHQPADLTVERLSQLPLRWYRQQLTQS